MTAVGQVRRTITIVDDLVVSRIGYGAMRLTDTKIWSGPPDRAAAIALLRRATELGVELVDTSDAYALGANEELIAEALHPYAGVVVATKVGEVRPSPDAWVPVGRPEYLKQQAELSLRRLRVDQLDLLLLSRVDPLVPLAEQVGALRELQDAGKVRRVGLSEVDVEQIRDASTVMTVAAVQNLYNLTDRRHDPVVDHCEQAGIALLTFYPMARGEHARESGAIAAVADRVGATPAQVALAWLLHRSPVVTPIPGTTSMRHLEENVAALDVELSVADFTRLSESA